MSYINAVNAAVQQYGDNVFAKSAKAAAGSADASAQAESASAVSQQASADQAQAGKDSSAVQSGSWADALSKAQSEQAARQEAQESKKAEQASEEELEKQREQARELTQKLNAQNIGLNFDLDDTYDRMVIKVTNKSTQDLVRQIPSEDLMRFQKVIADFESGDKSDVSQAQSYGSAGDTTQEGLASAIKGLIFDTRA